MSLKKHTRLSYLLALMIVLSYLESMIPFLNGIIPGLKIGLSNIVILFVLYTYTVKDTFYIGILRVILFSLLVGTIFSYPFYFSLVGAILSITVMCLLKKINMSIITVSIGGAIFHNIGQMIVAMILIDTKYIYMLPYLLILAIPSGIFTAIICKQIINNVESV